MKNKFKRIFLLAMVAVLFITHIPYTTLAEASDAKLKVVTSIFPQYDFVRQIAGDKVEVSNLLKPGADSHAYELTPQDVKTVQDSDLFIYVGGPEDHKFDELIESLGADAPKTMKLVEYVDVVNEEIVEGMQHEHDHDHEHHHHHHESFTKDDVEDRPLSEFAGAFQSMHQYYENGTLDDFVEEMAREHEKDPKELREKQIKNLYTPFNNIEITEDSIKAIENGEVKEESKYTYDGFDYEEHEGHAHVWYKFVKADDNTSLPKYIIINDHGYKANQEKSDDHIPHMHFAYSNESYEKALDDEAPMALYISSALTAEDIHDIFMGEDEDHDHEHHDEEHHEDEHHDHDHEHEHKDEHHDHEHADEHKDEHHEEDCCKDDKSADCCKDESADCCKEDEHHEDEHHDHDHEHEHHEDEHHDHDHEHHHEHEEIDEHVWTDPQNAIKLVKAIAEKLGEMDEANKELYAQNAENYIKELEAIDKQLEEALKDTKRNTILVGDRFPFRYLVDRYGLKYFAAFSGCSADTEVAAGTVKFLIDKVNDEKLPVVFKIELSNGQIASTISEATGAKVLTLNSAHNLTAEEAAAGKTFVDIMKENIEVLKEALN